MNLIRTTLVAAAAAFAFSTAAMAADSDVTPPGPGPYVGLTVGDSSPLNNSLQANGVPATAQFRDGLSFSGAVGYKWDKWFRTELEFAHSDNRGKYVNSPATPLSGSQNDNSVMANLLVDIPTGTRFTPYIGGGMGTSWLKFSQVHTATSAVYDDTPNRFVWQGIAGVAYTIAPNWEVLGEYRRKESNNNVFVSNVPGNRVTQYYYRANEFLIGMRISFGGPHEVAQAAAAPAPMPAPVAPPAPAPQAPPPPVPQKFLVFFDYDKSDLRADAEKIVAAAAQYAKTNGKATINATGYTDTMGSVDYNMALSERRAEAVQKALEKLGIPESEIAVHWKGKSDLLVQTGDHVKEPQNRRVEIILE